MPLSDDEKRHIEAVEEYRHKVRRRLHPDTFGDRPAFPLRFGPPDRG